MALYDSFADTFSQSRRDHPWPEIDEIIDDLTRGGSTSILDVGCGNGRFIEECEKREYHPHTYLGTDNSSGMIEAAQINHPHMSFRVLPMQVLDTLPGRYSAIIFLASFHHLETREERLSVLGSLRGLLAPGGGIYMTNWNLLDQPRYASSHQGGGDFSIKIGTHSRYYHGFALGELAELFALAGYEIIRHEIFPGGRNIFSHIRAIA